MDAEAEALEHAISPRLEQALADYLGEPREDPHGHPIPTPRGGAGLIGSCSRCPPSSPASVWLIREVQDDNPERPAPLASALGLDARALSSPIVSYQPLDDLFEVQVVASLTSSRWAARASPSCSRRSGNVAV